MAHAQTDSEAQKTFDELLGDACVGGLTNVLGSSGADAIVKHLGLGPHPSDAAQIDIGLVKIFQRGGARVLERQILKVLFDIVTERYIDTKDGTFAEQVGDLKQRLDAREEGSD